MRRALAMSVVTVAVAGCLELDFIQERRHSGTLRGVEHCVKYNHSDLVSEADIRTSCAQKHSKEMPTWNLNGRATYRDTGHTFGGTLKNNTSDIVYTQIEVWIEHEDENLGREYLFLRNVWLPPGETMNFFEIVQNRPKHTHDKEGRSMFNWGISHAKGVPIVLK